MSLTSHLKRLYFFMAKQTVKKTAAKAPEEKKEAVSKITVKPLANAAGMGQIYQSMAVKLSLLEKEDDGVFQEITQQPICFDFLVDVYTATLAKHKFGIYGFSWDGATQKPSWDGVFLNIVWPNKAAKEHFFKNLHFLHAIEKKNNITPTIIHDTGELTGVAEGSKDWLQNCLKLRFYLFTFRCFSYEIKTDDWITELGKKTFTDSAYIKNLPRASWDRILGDLSSIHTDYFCGMDISSGISAIHHNSGFFSTFSYHTEQNAETVKKGKHWQEMRKRGFDTYIKP